MILALVAHHMVHCVPIVRMRVNNADISGHVG